MPLLIIVIIIEALLAFAYPFVAYYLWREWDQYNNTAADAYADRCLYGAIAILLLIFFGKFLITRLLSKIRNGEEEPQQFETNKKKHDNATGWQHYQY